MSRIIGVQRGATRHDRALLASSMVASSTRRDWDERIESSPDAHFGWCGRGSPNLGVVDGVLAVVDGHVYNRADFSGGEETAAELIATLYLKHGFEAALGLLNGDFAVALHDTRTRTTWLARDRFGVKPLYYVPDPQRFAFASRPRALLRLPWVTSEVNRQFVALYAASHYRYFDNAPERSPYCDIAQLPSAHLLRLHDGELTTRPYWMLEKQPDWSDSEPVLAARYRDLLLDSVRLRLDVARRPIFTLSGGMDSSSVLACAVNLSGCKQHAISTIYEDATYDESEEIRSMLDCCVSQWHQVLVAGPAIVDLIEQMIDCHDEPVATATWLSHFLLCRAAASEGFASLFGGLGGDELNAGEYEYFTYFFADLRHAGAEERFANEVGSWARHHDHPVFRKSPEVAGRNLARLVDLDVKGKCLPDRQRLGRYRSALNPEFFQLELFDPEMDHRFDSYLKNRASQDLFRETIPCCLRAEDRQATALGLDHFLPFLDHRLVEFMFRVPGTLKIQDGVTKILLRAAMAGLLPHQTRTRIKKTGWNAPAHIWLSGQGAELLSDLVASRAFQERGIYDADRVRQLIDEHQEIVSSGRADENHMMFLWQLVNLELWFRWLDQETARC